jgi:hypothetical protein
MKFVLFLMFFITPPAVGSQKSWTLQSTSAMDFDSKVACEDALQNKIGKVVQTTDTVSLFGWCFPKDIGQNPAGVGADLNSMGSFYKFVPPQFPPKR